MSRSPLESVPPAAYPAATPPAPPDATGRAGGTAGPGALGRLGRGCYRHRWVTLLVWVAGVAGLIVLWQAYGAPPNDTFTGNDPGQTLLSQHFPRAAGDTLTLAIRSNAPIGSAGVRSQVTAALVPFERAPHVSAVSNPYRAPGQISPGAKKFLMVTLQLKRPEAADRSP